MASSSSPLLWKYDVFLSFRGEDTRRTFISHLHKELLNKGLVTFKDDPKLEKGDSISDGLARAIQDSRFAIVVLSTNYASSRWCLDELRMIMELQRMGKLIVLPIFYGVDPSDVRKQRGSFAEHFERFEGSEMAEKVQKWREALTHVANLSGYDSSLYEDEAKMIEEIVGYASKRLFSLRPADFGDKVGMNSHMEEMDRLLNIKSETEVRIIGIWGMGGIGKTTIAKYSYDRFSCRFHAHCFIENVKKISRECGLAALQEKFLSSILCEEKLKLWSVELGFQEIKARLAHRKVLVVLDDVDDVNQLHALAKETSWFGPGSRIIITTRDKGLLNSFGVENVYKVNCLEDDDALQMFNQFAFEGGHPSEGFERLSSCASQLARGLPLALEVFGSFLCGRTQKEWEAAIRRLERVPHKNVMEILKVSYDGLDEQEKTIFLHIACLFNGDHVHDVSTLLDDDKSEVNLGIKVLAENSLINISTYGYITVHDLVEQIGREIMRQQCIKEPWKRRILWDPQEIYDALSDNTGTEADEGIALNMSDITELSISGSVFEKMRNLKFLKFHGHFNGMLQVTGDMDFLPRKLRLLHWDAYSMKTLPSRFRPHCLVELNLRDSNLDKLWEETPELRNLKRLDLTGSRKLKELPDLSKALNLEELIIIRCKSLKRLPESICGLSSLTKLLSWSCDRLRLGNLPVIIGELNTLQEHSLKRCRWITLSFPNANEKLKSLTHLSIEGNINIELFPHLAGNVDRLFFDSKQQIPMELMITAQKAPRPLPRFYGFNELYIKRFNYKEDGMPFECSRLSIFPYLTDLCLRNLNIQKIPDDIGHLPFLETLNLGGNDFKSLPTSMRQLSKLKYLYLSDCKKLQSLPTLYRAEDYGGHHLKALELKGCSNLKSSSELGSFTNLSTLGLSRHGFEVMPVSLKELPFLRVLNLETCKKLRSLPEFPVSLSSLYAQGCESLETISFPLNHSVRYLDLRHCFQLNQVAQLITQFLANGCNDMTQFLANGCNDMPIERIACLPGNEVPICFDNQGMGNSITICLRQICPASEIVGFAACVILTREKPSRPQCLPYVLALDPGNGGRSEIYCELDCDCSSEIKYSQEEEAMTSDHMFVIQYRERIKEDVDELHFVFNLKCQLCKVKSCGIRLLSGDDQ